MDNMVALRLHGIPALILQAAPALRPNVAATGLPTVERELEGLSAVLAARLAVEGPQPRSELASLLWPQADAPRARANLRQRLLRLRTLAGRDWIVGDATLALSSEVSVVPWTPSEADQVVEWLQGVQPDGSEAARWVDDVRARLRTQHMRHLTDRLNAAERERRWADGLALAERMVALDPHSEESRRQVVRQHYLGDDLARASAEYARLRHWLLEEMGVAPSASTLELGALLDRASTPKGLITVGRIAARIPPALLRPPQCVGRSAELESVLQGLAQGHTVQLVGEAGMGKSRLLAELSSMIPSHCVRVGARPGDAAVPYALAGRWLKALLDATPLEVNGSQCRALAPLHDAWREGHHAAVPVSAMVDALGSLLCRAAHAGWDVSIVDDLHFADGASAELFVGMATTADIPMRWLFAHRPAEGAPQVRSALGLLDQADRLVRIELGPWDMASIQTLLNGLDIVLDGVTSTLAAALMQRTGGNPLFVLETLKQALLEDSLSRGELPSPTGLGALIERRLRRLSEPALTLARIAAIAGSDFTVELAEASTGLHALQLANAWQELQEAQVLRNESFAHDLVADAVIRGLPPVVARRVHGVCAQWLAQRSGAPARVAVHWLQSGQSARAGEAFLEAARGAAQMGRVVEEAALYQEAASAFDLAGLADQRFEARLAELTARVGADFGEETLARARSLVKETRSDSQRLRALRMLADLLSERSQADEAIEVGAQAMAIARRIDDRDAMIRVACFSASALCRIGRAEDALAQLLSVRTALDGQPDMLVMLWHGDWAAALGHLGRLRESQVAYELAMQAARREGRPDPLGRLMVNCAVTLRQAGRLDQALALSREGQSLLEADGGGGSNTWTAALVAARNASEAGDYAAAMPVLETLLPQFESSGTPFWSQACRMVLVQMWLHLGQPGRAVPLLTVEPAALPAWLQADRRLLQLEVNQALHRPPTAGLLSQALELASSDAQRGTALAVRALRHQRAEQVLPLADELERAVGTSERLGIWAALSVYRARAATDIGRLDEAAKASHQLLQLLDEGVAPESIYRAEAWLIAGRALAAAGDSAASIAALNKGARWVQAHALPHVPAPFVDSFLYRNPVNRALLAAVGSIDDGTLG